MTPARTRSDDGSRRAVVWAAATERELARRARLGLSVWVADDPSGSSRRLVPADSVEPLPLGTGERFRALAAVLEGRGAAHPEALAAWIGRRKHGVGGLRRLAATGARRRGERTLRKRRPT